MPKLASTAVERVDYAPQTETLDIRYAGGARYSYFGVPAEVYRALIAAPSVGRFVNARIKDRYRFELEPGRRRFRPE